MQFFIKTYFPDRGVVDLFFLSLVMSTSTSSSSIESYHTGVNTTIINLCVNVHIFYGQSHRRFLDRIIRWYAPFYPVHLLQLSLCIMKKNENVLKRVLNHSGWPIYQESRKRNSLNSFGELIKYS